MSGFNKLDDFRNRIILGDALEEMARIPSDSVEMTFADPPFNLKKGYDQYKDKKENVQYLNWCNKWLEEMVRITKPSGSIFVHNIPKWLTYFSCYLNDIAIFKHWIAWDAMGAPLGKTILPNHYGILWYVKSTNFKFYDVRAPHRYCRTCHELIKDYGGKKSLIHPFGTLVSDVWTDIYRIRHSKRRDEHPCQLPVHLMERLILMTTDSGDTVLDPFVGTGTTAVAAKKLGRKFIGIDLDKKYVSISNENLRKVSETKINDVFVSIFLNKVVTVRDKDYTQIQAYLKTKELKVNGNKSKQLTVPDLLSKPRIDNEMIFYCGNEAMQHDRQDMPTSELVLQNRLMEGHTNYRATGDMETTK